MKSEGKEPRKYHFILSEIYFLASSLKVNCFHRNREANETIDSLAKQGVDGTYYMQVLCCKFDIGVVL